MKQKKLIKPNKKRNKNNLKSLEDLSLQLRFQYYPNQSKLLILEN